ncbi:hypothetical protein CR513_14721, partial [Mucuna pruriens]
MAKLKYSTGKSRKHYKGWSIPTGRTGADSSRTLYGHIELHTGLCWGCLPIGLSSNIELTRQSGNATWPTTKPKRKGSSSYKNRTNSTWKPMRTLGSISRRSSNFMINKSWGRSKLRSRWDGPFVSINVFPYGAVELKDEHTNNTFQVNGHQIKLFHEGPTTTMRDMETISLMEPASPDDTL